MILLIDDDENFRLSLKNYLEEEKFIVHALDNAIDALQFLKTEVPEIIILDIIMPEINGYDFLKSLRERFDGYHIPVIVLTAKSLIKDRIQAYSLGCNAYLSKPFHMGELLSIINNLRTYSNQSEKYINVSPFVYKDYNTDNIQELVDCLELTTKEQRTLNLVVIGYMNKEIAKQLNTNNRHIERYISRLFNHFRVSTRTELVKVALQNHYITT
uniref:hypothetical protein n=1 Tax=Goniotrichopsis reniformis TaxID=468933 RepID=UPI001FCE0B64|nr:hypothetical protein MW428_pgp006 [Goniotrichopsis reniformis]UNJ14892.1 hypothetical protein [Goniotrichopsis reniformis]